MLRLAAASLLMATAFPAAAQDPASGWREGWHFQVTPYVWMSSLEGELGTLKGLPSADVDADFDDILDKIDLAAMLALDVRRGRFGFTTDPCYLGLSTDASTSGVIFDEVDLENTTFFTTLAPYYRVLETERVALDVLAGARVWYVDTELELMPGGPSRRDDET